MEALVILLIVIVVVLPPTAFFISLSSRKRLNEQDQHLLQIKRELQLLRQRITVIERGRPDPDATATSKASTSAQAPQAPASPSSQVSSPAAAPSPVDQAQLPPDTSQAPSTVPPASPPPLPTHASTMPAGSPQQGKSSPSHATAPRPAAAPSRFALDQVNWEQFMGVRLFAWLGGLALFLAAAFFVKYSFERDLIPPELRVAMGFLTGLGLIVGGVLLSRKRYAVTSHTLCGTGVVILYAVTFACRAVYHFPFFGPVPTFILMALITTAAFFIAVRLNALVVAVLGMLGGFLTPVLLSTGQDNPVGLFTYIALLDLGLIAVASARRWHWLNLASAAGTVLMQAGWTLKFFAVSKVFTAMTVFLGFDVLYLGALVWAYRKDRMNAWLAGAAAGLPLVTMAFVTYLMTYAEMGARPGVLASFLFGADLCLAATAFLSRRLRMVHLAGGAGGFLILSIWTLRYVTPGLLPWGLAIYLGFAVLHALFPVALQRRFPKEVHAPWGHLFPVLALLQMLMPILRLEEVSFIVWPVILLVDLLAIGVAVLSASIVGIVLVLLVTLLVALFWVMKIPADLAQLPQVLVVIGVFVGVFGAAGILLGRKILERAKAGPAEGLEKFLPKDLTPAQLQQQIPALSSVLPFLLLLLVVGRLPLVNPSAVFGMALLLLGLLLGLARIARMDWLPPIGLASVFLLEYTWHARHFDPAQAGLALGWYLAFYLALAVFPFLCLRGQADRVFAWISSALSGPLHFLLIYDLTKRAWPTEMMGMVPALFALPTLAGLMLALKQIPPDHPKRNTVLAWFGGVTLLFITLIFPIQFERHWLTIAWGLEGVALLWLYFRVPHPGLRIVGVALLVTAFVRLALNPAVLSYHPRASVAIFNWYLYTYGLVTACLFVATRLLRPPDHLVLGRNPLPLLHTLGTVLAFILLNIEIADYFSAPGTRALTFQFSGSFARDMTYSIAWSLFALLLLVVGILKRLKAARYAGIALLGVTLLKLFFHDLASLDQLYRVGALVGVAVVAIVASFLYQKFLSEDLKPEKTAGPGEGSNQKEEPPHE